MRTPSTRPDWTNLLFLIGAHLLAVTAVFYLVFVHFSWWTIGFAAVWGVCCGLAITGGYHRLFAHASYKASSLVKAFYLMFGAASVQNSALAWAGDHRAHHSHTDTDADPYNIKKGFWWAHIGWVITMRSPEMNERNRKLVRDLEKDPLVAFQHRYYVPLAIVFGAALPAMLGLAWGDWLGAMLVGGWLRLVVQWHATFAINSLTHTVGRQPFSTRDSARDSFLVALVTFGEGYHNFHHRFQIDYRNGIRWYHFDPTKWWVWSLSKVGLTNGLRRVPAERIEAVRAERNAERLAGRPLERTVRQRTGAGVGAL